MEMENTGGMVTNTQLRRRKRMRPPLWTPLIALNPQEAQIVNKIRKAKLFVFLRLHRHELFDEAFQQELATLYQPSKRGHPPVAPAQLALAVIRASHTQGSPMTK
jgi:hypothetical protein